MDPFIDSMPEPYRMYIYTTKKDMDQRNYDFKESLGLSFKLSTPYLYGIPERADKLLLKATDQGEPYRLYNIDIFEHRSYS